MLFPAAVLGKWVIKSMLTCSHFCVANLMLLQESSIPSGASFIALAKGTAFDKRLYSRYPRDGHQKYLRTS